jgi:hypothetical protein
MAFALDTLGYAKHLRDSGVPSNQAEAARDFIMAELVTKMDLEAALDRLTLRMTVRFGVMLAAGLGTLAAGLGALAAVLKLV